MSGNDPVDAVFKFLKLDRDASDDNQLIYHWEDLFEKVSVTPKQFFASIKANLESRNVPDLEVGLKEYPVGGLFSGGREYLHMRRERLVVEIGAGPFGTSCFVSSRIFDRRRDANVFHFILILFATAICSLLAFPFFGLKGIIITFTGIIALLWSLMRFANRNTGKWLHHTLPEVPIIGPIYERLFCPETIYRQDLNAAYRRAVHKALMQAIDEMTKQQGHRALTDEERKPVLRDLFRK